MLLIPTHHDIFTQIIDHKKNKATLPFIGFKLASRVFNTASRYVTWHIQLFKEDILHENIAVKRGRVIRNSFSKYCNLHFGDQILATNLFVIIEFRVRLSSCSNLQAACWLFGGSLHRYQQTRGSSATFFSMHSGLLAGHTEALYSPALRLILVSPQLQRNSSASPLRGRM